MNVIASTLIPPPRHHVVRLHGVFGLNSKWCEGDRPRSIDGMKRLAPCSTWWYTLRHKGEPAAGAVAGHGLRGSRDRHAFGDTNLYLRRLGPDALLEVPGPDSRGGNGNTPID